MRIAVLLPLRVASPYRCTCSNAEWEKKKKTWRLRHIGAPASATCGSAIYTHAHAGTQSPFPPAPTSHLLPRVGVFCFVSVFSSSFLGLLVSSPQGWPAAFQIQSDLRHGMCFNYLVSHGPSLGFPLVLALRLLYEGKGFWLTLEPYNDDCIDSCSQHLALFPFSPCGWGTRIWPTVPLVDHLYSMGHPPFQLLFSFEGWPPLHLCDLTSVPSLQIVDGSRSLLSRLCKFHFLS